MHQFAICDEFLSQSDIDLIEMMKVSDFLLTKMDGRKPIVPVRPGLM